MSGTPRMGTRAGLQGAGHTAGLAGTCRQRLVTKLALVCSWWEACSPLLGLWETHCCVETGTCRGDNPGSLAGVCSARSPQQRQWQRQQQGIRVSSHTVTTGPASTCCVPQSPLGPQVCVLHAL